MVCGVSCSWTSESIFYLLENFPKHFHDMLALRWAMIALWATCLLDYFLLFICAIPNLCSILGTPQNKHTTSIMWGDFMVNFPVIFSIANVTKSRIEKKKKKSVILAKCQTSTKTILNCSWTLLLDQEYISPLSVLPGPFFIYKTDFLMVNINAKFFRTSNVFLLMLLGQKTFNLVLNMQL